MREAQAQRGLGPVTELNWAWALLFTQTLAFTNIKRHNCIYLPQYTIEGRVAQSFGPEL